MIGSTITDGICTISNMPSARVIEWANVKAVICQNKAEIRDESKKRPTTNKMWSRPLGRMWV